MKALSPVEESQQKRSESTWCHALTLTERIAALRTCHAESSSCQNDQLEKAHTYLERWKNQLVFRSSDLFADRLALDAITEDELLLLLAEPVEHLQKRFIGQTEPAWLSELRQIWATFSVCDEEVPLAGAEQSSQPSAPALLDVLQPLVKIGSERLRQGIERLREASQVLPFDPTMLYSLFLVNLAPRLQQVAMRALVLEMHLARLEERLPGDTPAERFATFMRQFCQPGRLHAFLCEYPLLARAIHTIIYHWADYSLELALRLFSDWSAIRNAFGQKVDPGNLVEVRAGAGDTHRSGRSVAILRFRSGFRLVYKPRSLALDQHFQELLTWVNTLGIAYPLHAITILDRGSHGWVEFVQATGCSTEAEIHRFYERQGSYLALLYALDAADFHHENVLAVGEHPILVDLEALFHARLNEHDSDVDSFIARSIGYSVQRIGLLPVRQQLEEGGAGLDISGLGGQAGQLTPRPVPVWKEVGTDQMRLERERRELSASENRPTLLGQDVEVASYTSDILKGFSEMYRLLVRQQEAWLTRMLPRFEQDEVRVILRSTRIYATLLSESFHPERLCGAFERERLFDNLWDSVLHLPYLRRVIAVERQDLLQGDIPLFTTRPGSRDLFTSRGERIEEFCVEAGMESAKQRIRQMGESDLALQQWIIRASLVTTIMGEKGAPRIALPPPSLVEVTCEDLMQVACSIGNRLEALAVRGERGVNWLGIGAASENQSGIVWDLQAASLTLYDGLPGIILFLSYLGQLTGAGRYLELADMALFTLQGQIEKRKSFKMSQSIGGFNGLGSLIYLFAHLSVLRADTSYLHLAYELVEELDLLIGQDKQFDIIAGSAGCIACLLALYHLAPHARTLEMAIRCGDHLLSNARPMSQGAGWPTLRMERPLAGFSHGVAGIALSLLQLAQVSQQERFRQGALAALEYERSLFSPEQGNWVRFLGQDEQEFAVAWCHGAPGIGLGRLAALAYIDDEQIRREIEIALDTTLKLGFGHNQSICHGDLGNLEIVLMAGQALNESRYHEHLKQLTAQVFSGMQEYGWVTGVPLGVETPGLMTGLAGIGYELLRLAAPERVPSVLLLAPPSGRI